ncbi:MAG: hypothetical protein N0C90_12885 [Candidatus Thiodiazotropha endolucinida]|nr:hypothetical protein [Candidatus Thiodiazotropha taylori]MCW4262256.1 hypothetical protein [Candidatus Thiodiazotropha endolucinida]
MEKKLTQTMQQAVDFARAHDNKLTRHPGGIWSGKEHPDLVGIDCYSLDDTYLRFRTTTIQGLVSRGAAEYSDWKEGPSGRFPVEVTLTM